jgi:hypothetical protein
VSSNAQGSTSQPFGNNTSANADYNNLVSAVNSGNTSDAQSALAKLKADLKSGHAHGGHHHGGGTPPPPPASTDTTDSTSTSSSTTGTSGSILNVTV